MNIGRRTSKPLVASSYYAVGEARLLLDGRTLASVPLVLTESLTPRDYAFELERVLRSWPLQSEPLSE